MHHHFSDEEMNLADLSSQNPELARKLHTDHEQRLLTLIETCTAAGHHTLRYFRDQYLNIESKSDDSPVTIADREAEALARQLIGDRYPNDTLQGEEFSEKSGTSEYRWIVDPSMERNLSFAECLYIQLLSRSKKMDWPLRARSTFLQQEKWFLPPTGLDVGIASQTVTIGPGAKFPRRVS